MIILLVLLGAGLVSWADSRVYGPDGTYSLVPPSGWKFEKISRSEVKLSSGSSSLDIDDDPKGTDVGSAAFQQHARTKMVPKGYSLKSSSPVSVGGNPGFQLDLVGAGGNPTRIIIVSDKNRTWVITLQTVPAESQELFPLMEQSTSTLLFK